MWLGALLFPFLTPCLQTTHFVLLPRPQFKRVDELMSWGSGLILKFSMKQHCVVTYPNQDLNSSTEYATDILVAMCLTPCLALDGSDWSWKTGTF